jgi:hypothetical protein
MSDRELLEMAAKAAGITGEYDVITEAIESPAKPKPYGDAHSYWNPLADDGDALRLAVKLQIDLEFDPIEHSTVEAYHQIMGEPHFCATEALSRDPYAATRRAIVCAAAEIGKAMPLASAS